MKPETFRIFAIPPKPRRHGGIHGCNECRSQSCNAKSDMDTRYKQFTNGLTREA